jgi:hypothetical protein
MVFPMRRGAQLLSSVVAVHSILSVGETARANFALSRIAPKTMHLGADAV